MTKDSLEIVTSNGARSGEKILHLRGPLNIHTVSHFQTAVRAEEASAAALILDFSEVPHIDSAGLGALVGVHVSAQRQQRKLAFAGMNERVTALVAMTHLTQILKPHKTVDEAERALAPAS